MIKKNKKATILVENIVFIILNLLFLAILILFIAKQGSGEGLLEQSYAKNIALLIDSAKPVMTLELNMQEAFEIAQENEIDFRNVVKINENKVFVQLSAEGGYTYEFFNDVDATAYPSEVEGVYVFQINKK